MIVPKHYENLNVLHENTVPNRSYYIPVSNKMAADGMPKPDLVMNRGASDRFLDLDGIWKFRYFDSVYDLTDEFFDESFDTGGFDDIPVPSCMETQGYGNHQYSNIRYPFPMDPPYVPHDNPCGAYVRKFVYEKNDEAPRAFLNFEGADSCYYVWLNGKYVGYNQVTHSTGEFEVTDFLREGENTLAVLVLKWCDGSYLEDQDKFRMSGIFRDVYLLLRPNDGIFDYFVTTPAEGKAARVDISFTFFNSAVPVSAFLYGADGKFAASGSGSGGKLSLTVEAPVLWNPEYPYLYTLVLKTAGESIIEQVGIRHIEIIDNAVCLNKTPVLIHGVNRHDSDPVTGFTVSIERILTDLRLMKEHNVNAIRTSHYPNRPQFVQLCDRYGFMLIDEADCEGHGAGSLYFNNELRKERIPWARPIANNPLFTESVVDRVQKCVQRDKNRPSVIIWSMGNETAYGLAFEEALKWVKAFDSTRLTHYEGAQSVEKTRKNDYSNLDLFSRMYASTREIDEYFENNPDKPFIQCENSHAMGNGPGDLEDYFQIYNKYKGACGGFVWEWCDHAVYTGRWENRDRSYECGKSSYLRSRDKYAYGGDHGEYPEDGNFCCDGLVYPNRRPHTGLLEFKNVYRPARVVSFNQKTGKLVLHNYMDFTDLRDYANLSFAADCDGEIFAKGELECPPIAPHGNGEIYLPELNVPKSGKCYLKIYSVLKSDRDLRFHGHPLGFDEIALTGGDFRNKTAACILDLKEAGKNAVTAEECERFYKIKGRNFTYTFNRHTGLWQSLEYRGRNLLEKPMEFNIWRAPTDNDRFDAVEWEKAGYGRTYSRTYTTEISRGENSVCISAELSLCSVCLQPCARISEKWTVYASGRIDLELRARRNTDFPVLPRFGLRLFLPRELNTLKYYGLGPYENYTDKRRASYHGKFTADVKELHEDYIRPQENGSRSDCDFVSLSGGGTALYVASADTFSFNASVYTQEELAAKRHNYELEPSPYTVLCVDYRQNGIGSHSCGPELSPQYRLDEKIIDFRATFLIGGDTIPNGV